MKGYATVWGLWHQHQDVGLLGLYASEGLAQAGLEASREEHYGGELLFVHKMVVEGEAGRAVLFLTEDGKLPRARPKLGNCGVS